MDSLGGPSLRLSLAAYNNREDIDALITALQSMPLEETSVVELTTEESDFGDDLQGVELQQLAAQGSWQKRYRQLTRWAARLSRKPEIRVDSCRVQGCESEVWIAHRCHEQRHYFAIDTDSRVLQGLSVLILLLLDGKTVAEFDTVNVEATFAELGLEKYLSESRSNGFRALVDFMREQIR